MSRVPLVPDAQNGLDKMKNEFASEIDARFNDDYKGNITSKLNGYIGGPIGGMMIKKMVEEFEKKLVDK